MLTAIEALRYRALRYVSQPIERFQVLVGPNASGKSTFLDVVAFLGDLVRLGLDGAVFGDSRQGVPQRAPDPSQLVWMREGQRFELAVEMAIPQARRAALPNGTHAVCRYEVAIGAQDGADDWGILVENLWLKPNGAPSRQDVESLLFPAPPPPPEALVHLPRKKTPQGWRKIISRGEDASNVTFASETSGWNNPFRLGLTKSALANLPEDETKFPVATWAKALLIEGVQRLALSSESMRVPSPPIRGRRFQPDGSNVPWVVEQLERADSGRLGAWVNHVREALPDLEAIGTRERAEDRHRYLVLKYANGLEVPSWLVSDGTLRLLALTLLAYVPDLDGIYLIEEPENGIHPRAVEIVFESLSSVYSAQVLCATHSPVVLGLATLSQVLCFGRDASGATDVVPGDKHPRLREWRGETDLGTLFASGVLG
jgi:hypothetical protein